MAWWAGSLRCAAFPRSRERGPIEASVTLASAWRQTGTISALT